MDMSMVMAIAMSILSMSNGAWGMSMGVSVEHGESGVHSMSHTHSQS